MTKLKWDRNPVRSVLNSDYFLNPKEGFDKGWHYNQQQKLDKKQRLLDKNIDLGTHHEHDLDVITLESGPHSAKLICTTCNNKFIRWLPKGIF